MPRNRVLSLAFLFAGVLFGNGTIVVAIDIRDTKLLTQPAISGDRVAFVYAEDLWVADLEGGNVRRLTSDEGVESNPRFSPDGSLIAFSAQYDGNTDVFLVSAAGGVPKRLTWHPGSDIVRDFTPDGSAVLFISPRNAFTRRHNQLFTVSLESGMPEQLPVPHAFKAAYSPDGRFLAYTPQSERFRQWKNYRGGTVSRIWVYNVSNHQVEEIPQPEERCNDTDPMWIGGRVFFLSDRNGEFNVFSFEPGSGTVRQITQHEDFPVLNASAGASRIVYEQAGHLHQLDPQTGRSRRMVIGVAADLEELRPRYVRGNRYIRSASLSPSGARAVFGFRGEIVTVPAKKGDPRNLTETPQVHERYPDWSPDGRSIAYFSDESGEYELHVRGQDGKGETRKYRPGGAGFYFSPSWSPDGKKIAYFDNSMSLYWLDLQSGESHKVASEPHYGPIRNDHSVWSPDSEWLVYTLNTEAYIQTVYAHSLKKDKSYRVTDGLSEVSEPVFDQSGKYLYFFASTDAGPAKHWFAMSNSDVRISRSIYLAVLAKGVPSPLAKESDEEKGTPAEAEKEKKTNGAQAEQAADDDSPEFSIDFEGLDQRILALPVEAADYSNLRAGGAGRIYYLKASSESGPSGAGSSLQMYDLDDRQEESLASGIRAFTLSADRKKILYLAGGNWGISNAGAKIQTGKDRIATDEIQVRIDPRQEWAQVFDEAWRVNRDYFYDPGMHGADWEAMRDKYAPFLQHLAVRSDLNRVIRWMCSELAVGHHGVGGGDRLENPERVAGGLLGADFEVADGRYRFKKVYGGLNWNPRLRSPLTEPGVDVQAGEYLLAVRGRDLAPPLNLYSHFEATAGKLVEITVGPEPDGSGSRTVSVVPIENESGLRNRDWVEGNLKKVTEATDGRVAYVYVPNTAGQGHAYFKRYFFPQSNRQAVIVDERFNGGGQVADYYIDILRRPFVSYWNTRYGKDIKTPSAAIQGPKVMIIDETAGSGGDLLPWMFRKFKLGTLVGKRTWGGLVGVLGFPALLDGGSVSAPNLAIWTEDGFVVENVGVPPDVDVEQWPADVIAGRDPQLEKAIEIALEELKKNPPQTPKRPPYPVRARQ